MNLSKIFNELNKIYSEQEKNKQINENITTQKLLEFDPNTKAFIISKEDWEEWDW